MTKDDLLEIGQIVRPHGLKGRMKAKSHLVSEGSAQRLQGLFIRKAKGPVEHFRIRSLQTGRGVLYLELEGIEDADAAAALAGGSLLICPDQLEKLPEDEYYWHELLGLRVQTEAGRSLGRIASIIPGGNHDVYVCTGDEREILLPAVGEVIRNVDVAAGIMVVRLIEGL